MKKALKKTLGRVDKVDLPEMELFGIDAKIDTGAYTSAIHCHNINKKINKKGERVIHFNLLDPAHPAYNEKEYELKNFKTRKIKNSFGQSEKRFIIKTDIELFGKIYTTEFSLSDRGNLKYPILLGRKLLQGKFLVDVSRYDLSYKRKIKRENKELK